MSRIITLLHAFANKSKRPSLVREGRVRSKISIHLLILFTLFLTSLTKKIEAQVVLQLEKINQVKTYKYLPGSALIIKQKKFPEVWTSKVISEILVQENTIVFEDLIIPLDDIIGVRHENGVVKAMSKKLNQFGIAWLAFAGILQLTDRYEIRGDTFAVAGGAFALSFSIKALFFRKTFKIGDNSRLRILDLNMYNSNFD